MKLWLWLVDARCPNMLLTASLPAHYYCGQLSYVAAEHVRICIQCYNYHAPHITMQRNTESSTATRVKLHTDKADALGHKP